MKFLPNWLRSSSQPNTATSDRSLFIAKSAQELLFTHQKILLQIRSQVCVPETHWETLYQSFIESFAALVQEVPASESHHHSQAGGLLLHCLEVGLYALQLRSGKMLPLGASPEVISEKQEIWSYAVLTAAMMHDIGKPLVDQKITYYNNNKREQWKAFSGVLNIGVQYEVEFRTGRKYSLHETIPSLLASQLVSVEGLNWLSSDMDVLESWLLCLSGRKNEAGVLGEIITQADQLSVAENLTGSSATTQSIPTRQVPLHQRLTTGLKYLLDNDKLPLNRKGAAGWEYDGKLWLVSKRVLDELRKHLRDEAQSGIPSDNTRLMDELLQHGVLEATNDSRAIWKVEINLRDWKQEFTCLCIALDKLWSDQKRWPLSSGIQVLPVGDEVKSPSVESNTIEKSGKKVVGNKDVSNMDSPGNNKSKNRPKANPISSVDLLPLPPGIELVNNDNVSNATEEKNKTDHSILAQAFIDWLSSGIASGTLSVNQVGATIHIVDEGLLLVSPAIFRNYAKTTRDSDYTQVQHAFQSLGINTITPQNTNVWKYVVQGKRKKASCLQGMLINDPEKILGIRLPPANPVLTLEE